MTDVLEIQRAAPLAPAESQAVSDRERLSTLVDEHWELAGRVIRNLGAPASEIEDLLQQAFSITAARLGDIAPGKERAFLIQTAVRLTANARRRRGACREVDVAELAEIPDRAPSPEELSDQHRALQVLDRLLELMDLDLRTVFVLFEVEEMTMAEIASALLLPPGTVASRLRRAREAFASHVERLRLGQDVRREGGER